MRARSFKHKIRSGFWLRNNLEAFRPSKNKVRACWYLRALLLVAAWAGFLGGFPSVWAQTSAVPVAKSEEILLNGPDWKLGSLPMGEGERQKAFLRTFDDSEFRTVAVPGNVRLQIGLQGMDLYYQTEATTLVNTKEWWYRKHFTVPQEYDRKLLRLMFEGVDYFATVWLNGKKLGEHEGSYVSFSFDVTSTVNYGGENDLVVKVTCPWLPEGRGFLEYMKGEWAEVVPGWATQFPFAPYVLGPTWDGLPAGGNAVFPMGLWRDVRLVASGSTVIEDLFVSTKSLNSDRTVATLRVSGTINNHGNQDLPATLHLRLEADNFDGDPISVPTQSLTMRSGANPFEAEVVVENPHLWWTWDSGPQNLYKATATVVSPPGATAADSGQTVFGIRIVERKPDMSYWLNGRRVFLKGAWYPMGDYFGSKPTRETYEQDLEMFRAANLNHLVGFTVVEKPDFYDLCDRLGIFVFLEFPFIQFGPMEVLSVSNPRRDIYITEALRQIRLIVTELRNHPSIAVWAPFAEARMGGAGWGAGGEDFEQYRYQEFADTIGELVRELVPGGIYHPSYCDVGEQHFWMGNAGMGTLSNYTEHFHANTGFVSEYGSIALPVLETLEKMLPPEEMWSTVNPSLPNWYNLPIDFSAYAYQTSFDYDGLAGVLHRVNQFVDRHIRSVKELVEDSQLYQAFIFRYATESYRRKKYRSVNGTRIWAYGEVCPGIRFNFLDYFRVPKMGYYSLKKAQERFAVHFAYERALESQVSGTRLEIPVWLINDHRRAVPTELHCEILETSGKALWSQDFNGTIGSDESKQLGTVQWVTPERPGVYVLRAQAQEKEGQLRATNSSFIKVTPPLFSRPMNLLVIGQRKYSLPIAEMARGMGLKVEVIEESSIHELSRLRDAREVRNRFDVVWLASFDSLWKLLDRDAAEGLKGAIEQGVGFIHSGGPGSFHGGSIRAACLEFTGLDEALPVVLQNRNDLVFGTAVEATESIDQRFGALKTIKVEDAQDRMWALPELIEHGVAGFNKVQSKPGSTQILSVSGYPLLVAGRYGEGHTMAFTGFTPEYVERKAPWDSTIIFPYLLDHEFVTKPATRAYFAVAMRMLASVTGETPAVSYEEMLAMRDTPLFETLQDLPAAALQIPDALHGVVSANRARVSLGLSNGSQYARLLRLRAVWDGPEALAPYLVMYGENYFDLVPGETKTVSVELFLPKGSAASVRGRLIIEGSNVAERSIPITLGSR